MTGRRAPDEGMAMGSRSSAVVGRGSEYAELSRQVRAAGLLGRCPAYYRARIALNVGLLAVGGRRSRCSGRRGGNW